MPDKTEKIISSEVKYTGKIVSVRIDDVILSDGKEHFREVVEHPGGVVIIPVLNNNQVMMVRQWRHPVGEELLEFPAGKLDKEGEKPLDAAKRELEEETGFKANSWEYLGFIYTTPGFCNEKLHLYRAWNLVASEIMPDYGEIIEKIIIDIDEAKNMAKTGKIVDAKTIIGLSLIA